MILSAGDNFSSLMKRRLIYGIVIAILALNLAVGARIYFGSANAAQRKDSVYPNLELFANVLERSARNTWMDRISLTMIWSMMR